MSLPERERSALDAIEACLRRDDPRFAATMASLSAALPPESRADRSPPRRPRWKGVVALLATLGTACALALTTPHGSAACTSRIANTPTATVQDPEQPPILTERERYEAEHARGC